MYTNILACSDLKNIYCNLQNYKKTYLISTRVHYHHYKAEHLFVSAKLSLFLKTLIFDQKTVYSTE